jgi:hypothetical protein
MPDERTELQKRMDENLLPLGQRLTKPLSEAYNPDNLVANAARKVATTTTGQLGEAIGQGIRRFPQDTLNLVEGFNQITGINALKDVSKGVVRGVFGTENVVPAVQASQVTKDQQVQAQELFRRHKDRLDAADAASAVDQRSGIKKGAAGQGNAAQPRGAATGQPAQPNRLAAVLKDIQDGKGVEVIRGMNRSFKLFDRAGPGQDGEFTIESLQPGVLEGLERVQRAGGVEALAQDIKAQGLRDAARISATGGKQSIGEQLINHYTGVEGLSLPEAIQKAQAVTNPPTLQEQIIADVIRRVQAGQGTPEDQDVLRAFTAGLQPNQLLQFQRLQNQGQ